MSIHKTTTMGEIKHKLAEQEKLPERYLVLYKGKDTEKTKLADDLTIKDINYESGFETLVADVQINHWIQVYFPLPPPRANR